MLGILSVAMICVNLSCPIDAPLPSVRLISGLKSVISESKKVAVLSEYWQLSTLDRKDSFHHQGCYLYFLTFGSDNVQCSGLVLHPHLKRKNHGLPTAHVPGATWGVLTQTVDHDKLEGESFVSLQRICVLLMIMEFVCC